MAKIIRELRGTEITEWINQAASSVDEASNSLTSEYKRILVELIDDDYVDDEDIVDLLDGESELCSNGDDAFDAKVAALCKQYRSERESIERNRVVIVAANDVEKQTLESALHQLLPAVDRFVKCVVSSDINLITQQLQDVLKPKQSVNIVTLHGSVLLDDLQPELCQFELVTLLALRVSAGGADTLYLMSTEPRAISLQSRARASSMGDHLRRDADMFEDQQKKRHSGKLDQLAKLIFS